MTLVNTVVVFLGTFCLNVQCALAFCAPGTESGSLDSWYRENGLRTVDSDDDDDDDDEEVMHAVQYCLLGHLTNV